MVRIFEGILDIDDLKISRCENLIWVIKSALMKKLPCGANLKRYFLRFYKRNSFKNAMPNTQYFAILKKNALFPCETAGPNWLLEKLYSKPLIRSKGFLD